MSYVESSYRAFHLNQFQFILPVDTDGMFQSKFPFQYKTIKYSLILSLNIRSEFWSCVPKLSRWPSRCTVSVDAVKQHRAEPKST